MYRTATDSDHPDHLTDERRQAGPIAGGLIRW